MIVIDTREPQPPACWSFGDLPTVRRKLDAGDYSVAGFEGRIVIERKTLSDLIGTLTRGRERFERELDRLASFDRAAIVVEADFGDIVHGRYRSRALPQSVVGSLGSFFGRWGVPTVFAGSQRGTEILARAFLIKSAKHLSPGASEAA